jgi:hypothetical protein
VYEYADLGAPSAVVSLGYLLKYSAIFVVIAEAGMELLEGMV